MDNTNRPRKRVTKKMAQRRRAVALLIIVLVFVILILLIMNSCSGKGGKKPDTKPTQPASTDTTQPEGATLDLPEPTEPPATAPIPTADPNDPNTITGITLSMYEVYLDVGKKKMPIVTMTPKTSNQKEEIWTSSNEAVATVDWLGNITGVGAGECVVTVTSKNNPSVYAEVKVVVTSPYDDPANAAGRTPTNPAPTSSMVIQ